jgi:hypothetical protein
MNVVVQPWAPTDTLLLNTLLPSSAIAVGRPPEITQKKTGEETTTHTRTHARTRESAGPVIDRQTSRKVSSSKRRATRGVFGRY